MQNLWLIRHGESEANRAGLVTGTARTGLSEDGRSQCRCAAAFLKVVLSSADHRFVSSMRRARETAEIIGPGLTWCIEPALAETDAGHCAEWPRSRFDEVYPDFWNEFSAERPYPGGESHRNLYDRVAAWAENSFADLGKDVVVVCHHGSIASILHWAFNIPLQQYPAFDAPLISVTLIEWGGRHSPSRPVLRYFGRTTEGIAKP